MNRSLSKLGYLAVAACVSGFGGAAVADSVSLWNKLGSDVEAAGSEIGAAGTVRRGTPAIRYVPVKFGNGVQVDGDSNHPNPSYIEYDPGASAKSLGDRGTMEFWVKPDHDSQYGGIARWIGQSYYPPKYMAAGLYWRGWEQTIWFQICASEVGCTLDLLVSVPASRFSFADGEVFHVAMVWDREGIDGTRDTLRAYINGDLYGSITTSWAAGGVFAPLSLGRMDYPQHAALDNLIISDYAKTDFSGRFNESPGRISVGSITPKAEFKLGPSVNDDSFWVRGILRLADDSDGIDPLSEAVGIEVGSFTHSIPAGSFLRDGEVYRYVGAVGQSTLEMKFWPLAKPGTYWFKSCVKRGNLAGTTLQPKVKLSIGDDQAQTTLDVGYAKLGRGEDGRQWVFPQSE